VETRIPKGLYQQFYATGTSYIITNSGFNIALICGLLMAAGTRTIGKRPAATVTLIGIALCTLLVGADPLVVRATLMEGLSVIAVRLGHGAEACTFSYCAPTELDL
jgi:predicted membrane metal-binding protein